MSLVIERMLHHNDVQSEGNLGTAQHPFVSTTAFQPWWRKCFSVFDHKLWLMVIISYTAWWLCGCGPLWTQKTDEVKQSRQKNRQRIAKHMKRPRAKRSSEHTTDTEVEMWDIYWVDWRREIYCVFALLTGYSEVVSSQLKLNALGIWGHLELGTAPPPVFLMNQFCNNSCHLFFLDS